MISYKESKAEQTGQKQKSNFRAHKNTNKNKKQKEMPMNDDRKKNHDKLYKHATRAVNSAETRNRVEAGGGGAREKKRRG